MDVLASSKLHSNQGRILEVRVGKGSQRMPRIKKGLPDGEGMRRKDHLLPYKNIEKSSACGIIPTEHCQRAQTSRKAN